MAGVKVAGVMRAGAFSPNHVGNDTAIFNEVVSRLSKRGCEVRVMSEEEFAEADIQEDVIINMCREIRSVERLMALEEEGRTVVNSGFGIGNCTREKMTRLLIAGGIPCPDSIIVNTNEDVRADLAEAGIGPCWIKRGDFHAMHKEDVSYVRHAEEAQDVLQEYFLRGIKRAVINRHLEGDLVKFYGVAGTSFFFWFYPFDFGHSKYGHEAINGHSRGLAFDKKALQAMCQQAADVLDVKIYGGDCIVGTDGSVHIIDFNDWPSFAPCRNEAAPYIAKCVMQYIKSKNA